MTPLTLLAEFAVVVAAASLQAAVGFGFSLIAGPLLLMLDNRLVPGPALAALLLLAALQSAVEWRSLDRLGLVNALAGKVPGTALGLLALSRLPSRGLAALTGICVLAAVGGSVGRATVRPTRSVLLFAGALSGFSETTSSVGGPPVALAYRREPPEVLRATLAAYFLFGVTLSLIGLRVTGHFGWVSAVLAAPLLPAVPIGVLLARPLRRRLGDNGTVVIIGLSVASGLLVLGKALLS